MDRYLHHITLTTGHSRRSWRHEITPEIMPRLVELVATAREDSGALLPGITPRCWLAITDTARCALASIRTDDDVPVLTFAVADHQRCGSQLWQMLIETASVPCVSTIADRPETPWCAVRLDTGIALMGEQSAKMLGDLERCVAWAWLESRAGSKNRAAPLPLQVRRFLENTRSPLIG